MPDSVTKVYGGVQVTLQTDRYQQCWSDKGSNAEKHASFWTPLSHSVRNQYLLPVGQLGVPNFDNPTTKIATLLLGRVPGYSPSLLQCPVRFDQTWSTKGMSPVNINATVWRPIPPPGYVALGDFFGGTSPPPLNGIYCVHESMVVQGKFADQPIWSSKGTNAEVKAAMWAVSVYDTHFDGNKVAVPFDTFILEEGWEKPDIARAKVFVIPVDPEVSSGGSTKAPPLLGKFSPEPSFTELQLDRSVTLPFTCYYRRDEPFSVSNVANPFISIERWGSWEMILFNNNESGEEQNSNVDITVGVSKVQSSNFAYSAGVSVTAEAGIKFFVNAEISGSLNYQFDYESGSSQESLASQTLTQEMTTLPNTAAALWVRAFQYRSKRLFNNTFATDRLRYRVNTTSTSRFPDSN